MRISKGGTDMFCSSCKEVTTCKAVPVPQVTGDSNDYGQRMYYKKHDDINWFQRGRECLLCGHEFVTAEVDIEFLEELTDLRDALKEIKENAEAFVKESSAASKSLSKLGDSLSILRALKVYQRIHD